MSKHILFVKPLLQEIFTGSDLLLKGPDLVLVQPFIGLTACSMLHPFDLVV